MASRVNTKFVVILIVAVIAMLGMLFAAYSVVNKTADDLAKKGDLAMAEGDIETALRMYSSAVNKDPTIVENLEKWISTIELWIPETEPAYFDAFRRDYLGAIHQTAVIQRTNVEAYRRELEIQYSLFTKQYSRGAGDNIISRTTELLGNFDGVPGVDPKWPTLRRYRGMTWQRIADRDGVVEESQFELIRNDLAAAFEADPSDQEVLVSQMRWVVYEAIKAVRNDDLSGVYKARADAIRISDVYLESNPDAYLVLVANLALAVETAGADAYSFESDSDSARTQLVLDSWQELEGRLDSVYDRLMAAPDEEISMNILNRFVEIEIRVDPESKLTRGKNLMAKLRNSDPESLDILVAQAGLLAIRGETDEAARLYYQVVERPIPPVSIDGLMLFNAQREAMLTIASIKLDSYMRRVGMGADRVIDAEADEILKEAISARDMYAARVTEDNTNLMIVDGRIAFVNGEFQEALRLLNMYNTQTDHSNVDGLWFEALAAKELNQLGTARKALLNLIGIKKHNVRALLVLGNIEMQLKENRLALVHFQQALVSDPGNSVATDAIAKINALQNPDLIDDPVLSLIVSARQVRQGKDENPGDLSAAITMLSEGIEGVNYHPDVARDLLSLLMDQGDISGARSVLEKSLSVHPEDEGLLRIQIALQGENEVDILVSMIEQGDLDRVAKLVSIAGISFTRNRMDIFDPTMVELLELAPEDPQVIELAFVRSLILDDLVRADELVQLATKTNADRVNGLSFQSRLESFKQNHERAVQLLEQAASSGIADSSIYRMLAIGQRELGRKDASIKSFEHALSIRPDDKASIQEYIDTLLIYRQYPSALDTARRFQKYAIDDPAFLSIWLLLEAGYGGPEGRAFAIRQREKFLELDPGDVTNNFALAGLYIQSKRWDESRSLIDGLRANDDSLRNAELDALWYADQGRVGNIPGLEAARQIYLGYVQNHPEDNSTEAYIALARFMLNRGRPELAIQAATAAVEQQDPETLKGTKLLGDLYMMLNQFTNAGNVFREIVDSGVDQDDLYRLRWIDMLIRTRQFGIARAQFDQLAPKNSKSMIAILQNSEIEEGLGNSSAASELLDQAVASFSDNALVYIKRAEFLAGSDETLTDMLADVDAALQINPNDWRAYRVRAAGYFALDQRDEALRDLQRAVRLNPSLDQALFGIINELMIDGKNAEAYEFAVEIAESRKQDATLLSSLGQLFASREDWERASLLYKIVWDVQRSPGAGATLIDAVVRTRNPDTNLANSVISDLTEIAGDINSSPGLLAAQALVLQARGRDQLALQQLTKAFDISSDSDIELVQWSGNISRFFENQPVQKQIDYIQTLKQRNPNQEVLNWLDLFIAQRLVSSGSNTDTAYAIYDRLIGTTGQPEIQRISYQSYGTTMYSRGEIERAAELWGQGVELFPEDWEMSNNLAYVLSSEMGEHERALKLAENAIRANPNRSEPYDTIGNIYTSLGEYEKAEEMLNEGMKYALSVRSRVTLVIAQINMDLKMGNTSEARSKLLDIRSLMRAMPSRNVELEIQVDEVESKIDSAG